MTKDFLTYDIYRYNIPKKTLLFPFGTKVFFLEVADLLFLKHNIIDIMYRFTIFEQKEKSENDSMSNDNVCFVLS